MTQHPEPRSLTALPKAHLHLHFTGSMRHTTLLELAERDGIVLPDALVEDWPPRLSAADEKGWFAAVTSRGPSAHEDDVRRLVNRRGRRGGRLALWNPGGPVGVRRWFRDHRVHRPGARRRPRRLPP
jgi:adenosine deaminase